MRATDSVSSFFHEPLEHSMLHQMQDMHVALDQVKFCVDFAIYLRHEHASHCGRRYKNDAVCYYRVCGLYSFSLYCFKIEIDRVVGVALSFTITILCTQQIHSFCLCLHLNEKENIFRIIRRRRIFGFHLKFHHKLYTLHGCIQYQFEKFMRMKSGHERTQKYILRFATTSFVMFLR